MKRPSSNKNKKCFYVYNPLNKKFVKVPFMESPKKTSQNSECNDSLNKSMISKVTNDG